MTESKPGWAQHVTRVAVLTGAGISTGSGIPDYRGPDGVWTRDPAAAAAFTYDVFLRDAAARARFWQVYVEHPAWDATPNPAHRALADLDRAGVAVRVLTQNIDGLHQRALDAVVDVALYRYAVYGTAIGGFTSADLDGAFRPKR